jgi:hypothetical protein
LLIGKLKIKEYLEELSLQEKKLDENGSSKNKVHWVNVDQVSDRWRAVVCVVMENRVR